MQLVMEEQPTTMSSFTPTTPAPTTPAVTRTSDGAYAVPAQARVSASMNAKGLWQLEISLPTSDASEAGLLAALDTVACVAHAFCERFPNPMIESGREIVAPDGQPGAGEREADV